MGTKGSKEASNLKQINKEMMQKGWDTYAANHDTPSDSSDKKADFLDFFIGAVIVIFIVVVILGFAGVL